MNLLKIKAWIRIRPHVNPFKKRSYSFPARPAQVDWKLHYPSKFQLLCSSENECRKLFGQKRQKNKVSIIDIGCGYGGLLFSLSSLFPQKLIMGLQIRGQLVHYVENKIRQARQKNQCQNISVVQANAMKHLCHYFSKQSIEKIFVCFPDPHLKKGNHRRRIINIGGLSEFAFLLKPKGRVYCITDVYQLHKWHEIHFSSHSQFQQVKDSNDPCIELIKNQTSQATKWASQKQKFWMIYEKK